MKKFFSFILVLAIIGIGAYFYLSRKSGDKIEPIKPDEPSITLSKDSIGEGNLSKDVTVLNEKDSDEVHKAVKSIGEEEGLVKIVLDKNIPSSLKKLKEGQIFAVRPYSGGKTILGDIFFLRFSKIIKENDGYIVTGTIPYFDEVFDKLYIDTTKAQNAALTKTTTFLREISQGKGSFGEPGPLLASAQPVEVPKKVDKGSINYSVTAAGLGKNNNLYFSNIGLNIKNLLLCDFSKLDEKTNGKILLNGEIALKDFSLTSKVDFDKKRVPMLKEMTFRKTGKFVRDLNLSFEASNITFPAAAAAPASSGEGKKEKGISDIIQFKGVENNDINIASLQVDIGTLTIVPVEGKPMISTLGAAVVFSMNINGQVTASLTLGNKYSSFTDNGFSIKYANNNYDREYYNVEADETYPNPNTTTAKPTESQKNSKPEETYKIEGQIDSKASISFGASPGFYICNLNIARIATYGGIEGELKFKGTVDYTNKRSNYEIDNNIPAMKSENSIKVNGFLRSTAQAKMKLKTNDPFDTGWKIFNIEAGFEFEKKLLDLSQPLWEWPKKIDVNELSDKELINLIKLGYKADSDVINSARQTTVKDNNIDYGVLPDAFNTKDKIVSYLSQFESSDEISMLFSIIKPMDRQGKYSIVIGDGGEDDFSNSKVIKRWNVGETIYLTITREFMGDTLTSTYSFIHENDKWLFNGFYK